MRVIAGTARSLSLVAPEGQDVRPTLDRTKETLFNMLQHRLPGCLFMDIFSGSGAIGIEALSRGAKKAYFVENSQSALKCIEQNLKHTKLFDHADIIKLDFMQALKVLRERGISLDIIFFDPPFNKGFEEKLLRELCSYSLLQEDGLIICECSSHTSFDFLEEYEDYVIYKEKIFKTSKFVFIKKIGCAEL
ncbi:MAG: 16S rRNA (guanine(966)-N(2))-methyltransferase RsmD [Firmicutes bacterium HGW-Firmicutes-1]|jgi:16S rRNA (guanine966-N2)-methyltransferase|nr:MAG: 16S rRNA (guanine(966)-N(2))-methyltransferase RsmD [Firmicutes bacterium HGW-Firmicutes-1]